MINTKYNTVVSCKLYAVGCINYGGGIMLEEYLKLKEIYPKSIVLIKAGNFYECLNDDAKIMNSIFEYKIIRLKKYSRVGFPICKINYITGILTNKEINYLTFEDGVIETEKFSHNKYNDYFNDANCVNYNVEEDDFETRLNNELALKKIKSINKELHQNISNPKILDILNEIERVICKINL